MEDVFALYIIEDVQKNEASVNRIAQRRHEFTKSIILNSNDLSICKFDILKNFRTFNKTEMQYLGCLPDWRAENYIFHFIFTIAEIDKTCYNEKEV